MAVNSFDDLQYHMGHEVEVVLYGPRNGLPWNVAIECNECGEVLLDYDHPKVSAQNV